MPYRKIPLVTNHIYHVYNQGIDKRRVFLNKHFYKRFLITLHFYLYSQNHIRLAYYLESGSHQPDLLNKIQQSSKHIEVLAYCLMPNHFHLVIKQLEDQGISKYLANIQNSYTKYFNTKIHRRGSLFLNPFKAVLIESEEQLIHLVRYVHLNPFSSGITKNIDETTQYPYSSMAEYLSIRPTQGIINKSIMQGYFPNVSSHSKFIADQAGYQKKLESIKHLIFDENFF